MKQLRPSLLILIGSLLLSILVFTTIFINQIFINEYNVLLAGIISLIIGIGAYLIFYFSLKIFIQTRLQKIYKSIQSHPHHQKNNIDSMVKEAESQVSAFHDTRNLEISKLKTQEAFRRDFIGNLSHELKTPVFSIQGYIDSLLEGGIDNPETNKRFLERAAKSTERIVKLLEDLDQITRLESTELKIEMRPFDLIEMIKEIIESLEHLTKEKNIKIELKKEYSNIFVMGDRHKIEQVFVNLLRNSISYGNENGSTLITLNTIDKMVYIEIQDDGIGIESIHWPRLFERFYRVEKSRNRNDGGTGLGLSIVKHILESHGQTITLSSTHGRGTVFTFSLEKSSKNLQLSSRGIPIN